MNNYYEYDRSDTGFERKYLIKHKQTDEEKKNARKETQKAIRKGIIPKDNFCWWCLSEKKRVQCHHEDYSQPLRIVWLCGKCHFYARYTWSGPDWSLIRNQRRNERPKWK